MTSRSFHPNQATQPNAMSVSYIPVARPGNQYIMAANGQEFYVSTDASHPSWNKFAPTCPVTYPGYAPGQQCYIMMPENATMRPTPSFVPAFVPAPHWPISSNIPDTRLNPNSKEFVQKHASESITSYSPRPASSEIDSVSTTSGSYRRVSSPDVSENGLISKLNGLNLRYHSGDSGIAETSSSSTTWSSDDDVDSVTSLLNQRKSETKYEEIQEKIWTLWDDEQYWRSIRRPPPDVVKCRAIVKQIEIYMSDEYLANDKYLLRQIRCKKDGYVSIKLMTSFKKMKKIAQDWPVLRSAISRMSKTLVVSGEGLRIRRKQQLSEELRKPRMLTSILAIRLPDSYNAVEKVTNLFRIFGEIGLVRLLRQDKSVPVDLRNYATQVPDIGVSLCAVVEFETATDALSAVRVLRNRNRDIVPENNDSKEKENELNEEDKDKLNKILTEMTDLGNMRLALLGPRVRRTLYRQDREKTKEATSSMSSRCQTSDSDAFFTQTREYNDNSVFRFQNSTIDINALSWRNSQSNVTTQRSPTKLNNVIRQPRGAQETSGFQLHRNVTI